MPRTTRAWAALAAGIMATASVFHSALWLPGFVDLPRPLAPSHRGSPQGHPRGPRGLRLPCWCKQLDAGMVARHSLTTMGHAHQSLISGEHCCMKIIKLWCTSFFEANSWKSEFEERTLQMEYEFTSHTSRCYRNILQLLLQLFGEGGNKLQAKSATSQRSSFHFAQGLERRRIGAAITATTSSV